MDWKKETLDPAELERRQREYARAAMSMMKKSAPVSKSAFGSVPEPEKIPEQEPEKIPEQEPKKMPEPEPEKLPEQEPEKIPEPESEQEPRQEEKPAEQPEQWHDDGGNYGVYTADEITSGEYKDEGLKKAAEILEEMTRSTEMMKKLAHGDDEGADDTTDFPDFTCETDEDGDARFQQGGETDASPQDDE